MEFSFHLLVIEAGGLEPLEARDPDEKTQLQLTQWGKDNANDHSTIQCSVPLFLV